MLGCLGSCWIPVKLTASHLDVYLIIVYDFFPFFFLLCWLCVLCSRLLHQLLPPQH